jgi:hypothetical protein
MYPPVRDRERRRRRGSLSSAIETVLSRNEEPVKEIAPDLRGGRNDPVILPMAYSGRPSRLPDRLAERVFRNQDATDGDYYGGVRGGLATARDVIRGGGRSNQPPGAVVSVEESERDRANAESIDGLAHYLGVAEPHGALELSPYTPSRARQQGGYMRAHRVWDAMMETPTLPYALPGGPEDYASEQEMLGANNYVRRRPGLDGRRGASTVRMLLDATEAGPAVISGDALYLARDGQESDNNSGALLANFTLDRGQDERGPYISYYDRYDLDRVPLADRVVGRSFELYDRLYYDPETLEPLPRTPLQAITRRSPNADRKQKNP